MTAYDIRTKAYLLKKSKGGKFHCPVCNGPNLNIQHSSGAYKCYSSECSEKAIREAIDALEGKEPYKPKSDWQKPPRKQQRTEYFYPARNGTYLAKVTRIDDGEGGKKFIQAHHSGQVWINGMPEEIRPQIPIYNYGAVRDAINDGHTIWVVEGEACVDALAKLGIFATTTIGGSGGFSKYGDYSKDLEGANIFLCPDRDSKGLEYMAQWEKLYPDNVIGYYLAGSEGLWANPMGGMDISDDLTDHGYTVEQLLDRIVTPDKLKELTQSKPEDPAPSPLLMVTDLQRQRVSNFIQPPERTPYNPFDFFPERLAQIMIEDAELQCVDPLGYVPAILPAVSSLMGYTHLDVGNYKIPNILWTMIVQGSGEGKSRIDGLVYDQIRKWEYEANKDYEKSKAIYDTNQSNASRNKNFTDFYEAPPVRRRYLIGNGTISAIEQAICLNEESTFLWTKDEITSIFKGLNRFSQGDGGDLESLLEMWGGNAIVIDRVDGKRSMVAKGSRVSLSGGIQPGLALKTFNPNDYQGFLARFLPFFPEYRLKAARRQTPRLERELPAIYSSVNGKWQPITMTDEVWVDHWAPCYDFLATLRSPIPALQNWYNKSADHMGRVALALHAIECHYDNTKALWSISGETLDRAYALILRCAEGVAEFCGSMVESDEQNIDATLSPQLVRIIKKLKTNPDGIQLRDIYQGSKTFASIARDEGITVSTLARKCCEDLARLGYITWDGKTARLSSGAK
jgi:hypothetical protein